MYMKSILNFALLILVFSLVLTSCKKDPEGTAGCNDSSADNFNSAATEDNGTCTYQKRYLGDYTGVFSCAGSFAAIFSTAEIKITEQIEKSKVVITIASTIGDIPVEGTIKKDSLFVDALLTDLKFKANQINPLLPEVDIVANGTIKTVLKISSDNKILTGDLNLAIKPTSPAEYAIFALSDVCGLVATKK
jgi:hypothetical protein